MATSFRYNEQRRTRVESVEIKTLLDEEEKRLKKQNDNVNEWRRRMEEDASDDDTRDQLRDEIWYSTESHRVTLGILWWTYHGLPWTWHLQRDQHEYLNMGVGTFLMCMFLPLVVLICCMFIDHCVMLFEDCTGKGRFYDIRAKIMVALSRRGRGPTGSNATSRRLPPDDKICFWIDFGLIAWLELIPLFVVFVTLLSVERWTAGNLLLGYVFGLTVLAFLSAIVAIVADVIIVVKCLYDSPQQQRQEELEQMLGFYYCLKRAMETYRMVPVISWGVRNHRSHWAFKHVIVEDRNPVLSSDAVHLTLPAVPEDAPNESSLDITSSRALLSNTSRIEGPCRRVRRLFHYFSGLLSCKTVFLICVIISWLALCIMMWSNPLYVLPVAVFLSVFAIGTWAQRLRASSLLGSRFTLIAYSMALVMLLLCTLTFTTWTDPKVEQVPLALMSPCDSARNVPGDLKKSWENANGVRPYPVCMMEWGGQGARLSTLDVTALARIAYAPHCYKFETCDSRTCKRANETKHKSNNDSVERLLEIVFEGVASAPILENCSAYHNVPRTFVVKFPSTQRGLNGTRVVAVKGTSTPEDALIDASIFAHIELLQLIDTHILPILSLMPLQLTSWMLNFHVLHRPIEIRAQIWEAFTYAVRAYARRSDAQLMLTGHSLGGGLAEIWASKIGVDALVFSAPGSRYMRNVFGIRDTQKAQKYVNILPDHDAVPRVDSHYGVLQKILCRDRKGRHASMGACHGLVKTGCELWRVCGDAPRNRNFSHACRRFVDNKFLGNDFPEQPIGWWAGLYT